MKQIKLFEERTFEDGEYDDAGDMSFEEYINSWMIKHQTYVPISVVGKGDGYIQVCITYEEE